MEGVTVRELRESDLRGGFLASLDSLRIASSLEDKAARGIFAQINSDQNHVIFVAELKGRVVGCATILIEQKFIHNGGRVAHIEDVAVRSSHHGMKIGGKIIRHALEYAKNRGCYKTVLTCRDEVMQFYEKLGFRHETNALRFDHG